MGRPVTFEAPSGRERRWLKRTVCDVWTRVTATGSDSHIKPRRLQLPVSFLVHLLSSPVPFRLSSPVHDTCRISPRPPPPLPPHHLPSAACRLLPLPPSPHTSARGPEPSELSDWPPQSRDPRSGCTSQRPRMRRRRRRRRQFAIEAWSGAVCRTTLRAWAATRARCPSRSQSV